MSQFSHSVMSYSLWPHGLQHTRPPCPSPFAQVHNHYIRISSNCLTLWLSLLLLPSVFPSIRDFYNELSVQIRRPKYWSFSTSPSSEYSGLISLKIEWSNLLAVQGTFRNVLQHPSSKALILWCSALFMVQLSQPYMTTVKGHSFNYTDLCRPQHFNTL